MMSHSVESAETICQLRKLTLHAEILARTPGQYPNALIDCFHSIAKLAIAGAEQTQEELRGHEALRDKIREGVRRLEGEGVSLR